MLASPPSFQHSATGLAALNMDSQVVSRSTPSTQHAQLGIGQPTQSSGTSPSLLAAGGNNNNNTASGSGTGANSSVAHGHSRRISSSGNVQPIGRPSGRFGPSSFSGGNDQSGNSNSNSNSNSYMADFGSAIGSVIGDDDIPFPPASGSGSASLRSISPPPAVLGSGALLDDMMEEEGLEAPDGFSPSIASRSTSTSFFGSGVFAPPGIGSTSTGRGAPSANSSRLDGPGSAQTASGMPAEDVWAGTPSAQSVMQQGGGGGGYEHIGPSKRATQPPGIAPGAGWAAQEQQQQQQQQYTQQQQQHHQQLVVAPDRASVIRDRARISFTQLDAASQPPSVSQAGGALYPIGDVYRVFLALYPDSTSVDVREFLESCLTPGNLTNGNGTFNFQQRGQVLLMAYE